MKQTAVDWLIKKLYSHSPHIDILDVASLNGYWEQAKEMERQQIIEAHGKQLKKTGTAGNYDYWLTGEQYYRENY